MTVCKQKTLLETVPPVNRANTLMLILIGTLDSYVAAKLISHNSHNLR